MPLTELKPSPDYEKVIETCGGKGEKVEGAQNLLPALRRGIEAVRSGTPATAQRDDAGAAVALWNR